MRKPKLPSQRSSTRRSEIVGRTFWVDSSKKKYLFSGLKISPSAALYKRPNSKFWWMKFTFDGELIQQSTKCKNKRAAETVESAYRTQLALGKLGIKPRKSPPLFKEAVEDFLKWSKLHHATKPNSYRRMNHTCQPLKKFFGNTKANLIET